MDVQDPYKPGHMSVTLKADGKDGTWIVFHGDPAAIRSQITTVFDLNETGDADAPLYDLINEATRIYKSTGTINAALGGRTVGGGKDSAGATGSAWDRAGSGNAAEQAPPVDINVVRLTNAIENATNVAELKELFARNKAFFDENAELFAAWQAKGKALTPTS